MSQAPRVSVIIPTYNWSAALRCAIESVLLQTMREFEIIVVGDACSDDSEAVVASFGDARIRWINCATHFGHQWGPNNEGLRAARAEWIAYLGHDDIWYPTHLEATLTTAIRQQIDIVSSVTLFYGPPGSGIRAISGVFHGAELRPPEWVPPPSWLHRRSLIASAGYWRDPLPLSLPSDVDFFRRLLKATSRAVSTNELTVFKFNAGMRDTYKLKNNDEQRQCLATIRTGTDFRHRELIGAIQAEIRGLSFQLRMPKDGDYAPGDLHVRHRKLKGVKSRFSDGELRTLEQLERFMIPDSIGILEWYDVETHPAFGSFRWSGPQARSVVDLPVRFDREFAIRIHILSAISDNNLPPTVSIGSVPLQVQMEKTPDHTFLLTTTSGPIGRPDLPISIAIEVRETLRPCDLGPSPDTRHLGVAVNWIELEPVV